MTLTITRRRLAAPAAALVALLALAACGGSSGDDETTEPAAAESGSGLLPAAEGTTEYPLTLTSPWGETVLEKRPERIAIVTAANDLDNTLALGVTPVFADEYMMEYEWAVEAGAGEIESKAEITDVIPFEAVAASKPDLLIAIQTDEEYVADSYTKLAAIAPVLTVDEPSWDVTWQESVKLIGKTLDLTKHADEVVADVEGKVAAERTAHPAFEGKTLSFVFWHPGLGQLTYRSFAGSATEKVFDELGFVPSAASAQYTRDEIIISKENYGKLDADVVLIGAEKEPGDALLADPVFKAMPAITEGRYARLDTTAEPSAGWAMSWPSALSLPWITTLVSTDLGEVVK